MKSIDWPEEMDRLRDESSVLQDDLRDMLVALGLPDGARPQSPHEVFQECIEEVKRLRSRPILGVERENERLRQMLRSVSAQCGNVIFNCEQKPADNARHLASWRGVKEFADAAIVAEKRGPK